LQFAIEFYVFTLVIHSTASLSGAVQLLVLCLQESELYVKQIAASAVGDISKHSTELAQAMVDAGAIVFLAKILANPDAKAKVTRRDRTIGTIRMP